MLGYPVGDRLIAQLGKALASSCRAQDLVARACGAGFGVVLNDTSQSEARVVCRRVSEMLEEIVDQSGSNRLSHVHLTIGMAERNADDTAKTLIGRAFQQPELVALRRAS
jgi:diguanylate cyclase (GGDEF)-like protein